MNFNKFKKYSSSGVISNLPGYNPVLAILNQMTSYRAWDAIISKKWQDVARTTIADAPNDPVQSWEELSGSGDYLTQSTGSMVPVLSTNPYELYFEDNLLENESMSFNCDSGVSTIIQFRSPTETSNKQFLFLGTDSVTGNNRPALWWDFTRFASTGLVTNTYFHTESASWSTDRYTRGRVIEVRDFIGGGSSMLENGTVKGTATSTSTPAGHTITSFGVGGRFDTEIELFDYLYISFIGIFPLDGSTYKQREDLVTALMERN